MKGSLIYDVSLFHNLISYIRDLLLFIASTKSMCSKY